MYDGRGTLRDMSQLLRGHWEGIGYCADVLSSRLLPAKYLGHVEVEESRGMHVCEDAVKKLKAVSEGWSREGASSDPERQP